MVDAFSLSTYNLIGNLENDNEVLGWLIHQMKSDEIEEVTLEMLEMLKETHPVVACVFCKFHQVLSCKKCMWMGKK